MSNEHERDLSTQSTGNDGQRDDLELDEQAASEVKGGTGYKPKSVASTTGDGIDKPVAVD